MGFPEIFICWIKGCISTATFSVTVNGELEGCFTSSRGLRQGYSLSPLLFVLVINVLSHRLDKAAIENRFGFHPKCKKMEIIPLSFTDDMIIFTDGSTTSINGIVEMLKECEQESGLAININSSASFMVEKTSHNLQEKVTTLGISIDQLPIRYLDL